MGRKMKHNARLLEVAFSRPEWEYLKRNEHFIKELEEANLTVADFQRLSLAGSRLLAGWEERNPSRARFKRTKRRAPRARQRGSRSRGDK